MPIEVTVRHQNATPGIKDYAEKRAARLVEQFPRVESVHVTINAQRQLYETQFVVQQKSVTAVGATEHSSNLRSAIDTAAARVERQLRKNRNKRIDVHVRKADRP